MDHALQESTGLNPLQRKKIAYWTLATHSLPQAQKFPPLCLYGRFSCGKSTTMEIIKNFARIPFLINLRRATPAMLRDHLAGAQDATAIIEEGDGGGQEDKSEGLISDRYQRSTATADLKKAIDGGGWTNLKLKLFGATVFHRRIPIKDPALESRALIIKYRSKYDREYLPFLNLETGAVINPEYAKGRTIATELGPQFKLPPFQPIPGIAGRIQVNYAPLISLATELGDTTFISSIAADLQADSAALKEAQGTEPDGLVLQAILAQVFGDLANSNNFLPSIPPNWGYVKLGVLKEYLWKEHRVALDQRQIAAMARDIGFRTVKSHGVTAVDACRNCEYDDLSIQKLRDDLSRLESTPKVKESAKEKGIE